MKGPYVCVAGPMSALLIQFGGREDASGQSISPIQPTTGKLRKHQAHLGPQSVAQLCPRPPPTLSHAPPSPALRCWRLRPSDGDKSLQTHEGPRHSTTSMPFYLHFYSSPPAQHPPPPPSRPLSPSPTPPPPSLPASISPLSYSPSVFIVFLTLYSSF